MKQRKSINPNRSVFFLKISRKEQMRFFLWISPWMIGFVMLTLLPLLGSLYISFTEK